MNVSRRLLAFRRACCGFYISLQPNSRLWPLRKFFGIYVPVRLRWRCFPFVLERLRLAAENCPPADLFYLFLEVAASCLCTQHPLECYEKSRWWRLDIHPPWATASSFRPYSSVFKLRADWLQQDEPGCRNSIWIFDIALSHCGRTRILSDVFTLRWLLLLRLQKGLVLQLQSCALNRETPADLYFFRMGVRVVVAPSERPSTPAITVLVPATALLNYGPLPVPIGKLGTLFCVQHLRLSTIVAGVGLAAIARCARGLSCGSNFLTYLSVSDTVVVTAPSDVNPGLVSSILIFLLGDKYAFAIVIRGFNLLTLRSAEVWLLISLYVLLVTSNKWHLIFCDL